MCGSPIDGCNPKAFVDYLGNNPQSPFIFDMNITDTDYDFNSTVHIKPINTTMSSCSQSIKLPFFKAPACGCSDCTASCPGKLVYVFNILIVSYKLFTTKMLLVQFQYHHQLLKSVKYGELTV